MIITKEYALVRLLALPMLDDPEKEHVEADAILCEFLRQLGYVDIVEAYEKIHKWYA